ncbi:MAG: hypothetical protein D9V46_06070 [Deltaproteobacteria bacterium]|uniref:hypothetical protein n=1 Tax=Hydrosulfovibrio ferrireducens TaxID=2934181 RepID=UPI0011F660AD|nr:MAG: hypothetical protein D9V46_06070 [Deltaproteobacteria bacterium]
MALLRDDFGYGIDVARFAIVAVYEETFPPNHIKSGCVLGRGEFERSHPTATVGDDIHSDLCGLEIDFLNNSAEIQLVHREGLRVKQNARKHKGTG